MDMELVDTELPKPFRFMRSLPVGNRFGLQAMRALMPLAGRTKVPHDIVFETMPRGRAAGVRIDTPHEHPVTATTRFQQGRVLYLPHTASQERDYLASRKGLIDDGGALRRLS